MKNIGEIRLRQKKQTKGTVVYDTDRDDAMITQVYVMKRGLPEPFPESITIQVFEGAEPTAT